MPRGQTSIPRNWLIVDRRPGDDLWPVVQALPSGSGILLIAHELAPAERRRLKRGLLKVARSKGLALADEAEGDAIRVHNARELRNALGKHIPLLLISPINATRSHPGRKPLPRMRAATLARLAGGRAIALGGMNATRFRAVERLGFSGWAGIDAYR